MKPRLLLTLLVTLVVGAFALLNWAAFSVPASLNLLVAQVEAPLGQVLLGVIVAVMVIYLALLSGAEAIASRERKRVTKESDRLRKLAETGEDSRLESLRADLNSRFDQLDARLERLEKAGGVSAQTGTSPLPLPGPSFHG